MRGKTIFSLLLVILFILSIIAGARYFSKSSDRSNNGVKPEAQKQPVSESQSTPADWREYRNANRGFALRYPPELSVQEYDEGDGTYTLVFEAAAREKSFQIFFTPYLGETITRSRLLRDVPSGEFTEPIEVIIGGGGRALMFVSQGPLGPMREVWFIRDGYLFEVTAPDHLDGWLADIMGTWQFF